MSAIIPVQMAAPLEDMAALTANPEIKMPPYPAATVFLLRSRGHQVSVRQQKTGSLRYRVDGGRELLAVEMGNFYSRKYER